jgi:hypothetical protein
VAAASIELTSNDLRELEQAAPRGAAAGDRYTEAGMRSVHI